MLYSYMTCLRLNCVFKKTFTDKLTAPHSPPPNSILSELCAFCMRFMHNMRISIVVVCYCLQMALNFRALGAEDFKEVVFI